MRKLTLEEMLLVSGGGKSCGGGGKAGKGAKAPKPPKAGKGGKGKGGKGVPCGCTPPQEC
jgi:hypothetical protein